MPPGPPCIGGIPSPKKYGVADKNRRYNPALQVVSITTLDEQTLAVESLAISRSRDVQVGQVLKEAARLYNEAVLQHLCVCTETGADRKQYRGTTTDVLLEAFFLQKSRLSFGPLNGVPGGSGGPQPELQVSRGPSKPIPTEAEIATFGRNRCRTEIRSRGGSCANSLALIELRKKLQELVRKEVSRAP